MSTTHADALLPLTEYREKRQRLFPSPSSFQWYLRQRKEPLIEAGALLMICGRYHVDPAKFDQVLIECGAKDAQRMLGAV